jgi:hypothetical protein
VRQDLERTITVGTIPKDGELASALVKRLAAASIP